MELSELPNYKNQLMKEFCCDANIVHLLTGNEEAAVPNHGLPYTQMYPFAYVPETVDEARSFLCFDVDIVSVPNETYLVPVVYVWVFAHKSNLRMEGGGVLIDQLVQEAHRILNGSWNYGLGKLKFDSCRRFTPINGYLGRVLTYYALDFNRNGDEKKRPARRAHSPYGA